MTSVLFRAMVAATVVAALGLGAGCRTAGVPAWESMPPSEREAAVEVFAVDGVKVIHKRTPGKDVVSAKLFIRGGAAASEPEQAGIDTLLWTVATTAGTELYDKDEFNKRLASMGSVITSHVGRDYSDIALRCVGQYVDASWELFVEAVSHPLLADAEVERQRERQLAAIRRQQESPDKAVMLLANELTFAGHPYETPILGTEQTVASLDGEQLAAHHRSLLVPSRLLLVVVADLDRETVAARAAELFVGLGSADQSISRPEPISPEHGALAVAQRPLPTNYLVGYFPAPAAHQPGHAEAYVAYDILRHRLFEELRTKRNLTYAVYAGLASRAVNVGVLYVTATDVDEAMRQMFRTIDEMAAAPVPDKELVDKKREILTRYLMGQETNAAQASQLGYAELVAGDWRFAERLPALIQAVTPEGVQRAIEAIQHVHVAVVGPAEELDRDALSSR